MRDIDIRLSITTRNNNDILDIQIKQISYILNETCAKLEALKCDDVYYKILVEGKIWNPK